MVSLAEFLIATDDQVTSMAAYHVYDVFQCAHIRCHTRLWLLLFSTTSWSHHVLHSSFVVHLHNLHWISQRKCNTYDQWEGSERRVELWFFHILVWRGLKSMYLHMKQIYLIQMWMYTSLSLTPLWCCHVTLGPLLQGFCRGIWMLSVAIESCHCNPSTSRN